MERELGELRRTANRMQSEVVLLRSDFDDARGDIDRRWEEESRLQKTLHETTLTTCEAESYLEEVNTHLEEAVVELSWARKEIRELQKADLLGQEGREVGTGGDSGGGDQDERALLYP
ncbi:hypothetical protein Zm00014a_043000 [Zea mays]|uniref:Uncharacterized protein n=1 Tax=Zea mays TaxID=4577 RepID=A0A3L6FAP2_MAIZE|nr:hypothetical protein Zm00014a_043000 [Zea mays]